MGELLGIPEWLAVTLWVVLSLAAFTAWGLRSIRKAHHNLAARRANPTRDEFMSLMATDVSPQTSAFLWKSALFHVEPVLTPPPEDHLSKDLRIDDDDWSMDWSREFCRDHGSHESNLPDWPDGWDPTVRNLGRWLDLGAAAQAPP